MNSNRMCSGDIIITKLVINVIILSFCLLSGNLNAQSTRNLLSGTITELELESILISQEDWHPYPTIVEREKWVKIPENIRELFINNGS